MYFVTQPDLGQTVLDKLSDAVEVRLAVAYFNPDKTLMTALRNIPRLKLIVSEEFTINNPYKLEKLAKTATVRSVPTECHSGKLHAKVLIAKQSAGDVFALVGSANMTWQGLFSNQEACVALESRDASDKASLKSAKSWFDALLKKSRTLSFNAAKQIFDTRSQYRLERRATSTTTTAASTSYWALKCTSGSFGKEHWQSFLSDSVVAVGWPDIKVDPSTVSKSALSDAIARVYPSAPKRAAGTIKQFIDLKIGDIVVVCRGFPPNSHEPVNIHGIARVTGPFYEDRSSSWEWRFKRDAVIQRVESQLPKDVVAKALKRGSLLGTLNAIDRVGFDRLVEELGVSVDV